MAHAFGMAGETIPLLSSHSNPSDYILETITNTDSRKITIKDLQNALETIERWDVIDDTETLFGIYFDYYSVSQYLVMLIENLF